MHDPTTADTCPECNGFGDIYDDELDEYVTCSMCEGTGEVWPHELQDWKDEWANDIFEDL